MATIWMRRAPLLALAFCLFPAPVRAQVVYDTFDTTPALQLNGDAHVRAHPVGDALALTDEDTGSIGSAFHQVPVDATSFSTMFEFRILPVFTIGGVNCGEPDSYADGLTFTLTGSGPQALGQGGERVGYEGILDSFAVEVDHWCNSGRGDPSSNHIGFLQDGSATHAAGGAEAVDIPEGLFHDRRRWTVWVDYDGMTVEVRVSGTGQRPALPVLSKQVDIPALVGGATAYAGFTAANGAGRSVHGIVRWEYRDYGDMLVLQPATPGLAGSVNDLEVGGLEPGRAVVFAASATRHGRIGHQACPGITLDLDAPTRLGVAVADAQGLATLQVLLPTQAAGRTLLFQAVQEETCRVTNTVMQVIP